MFYLPPFLLHSKLIEFIFESETMEIRHIPRKKFAELVGEQRFERLSSLYSKLYRLDHLVKISDVQLEDLLTIYYWNDPLNGKTIEDIKNDFMIKNLLE